MDEITVRFWQPQDIPDLQKIFTASFGDPPEIAEAFFNVFLTDPEACTLAAVPETGKPDGRPVAAAYCLPGPALCFPERRVPSAYPDAFGCLPERRVPSAYLYAFGCLPERRVPSAYPDAFGCLPERRVPSAYLYAFGCLPEWRGQGIMRKVYTAVFEAIHRQELTGCLIPASDRLLQAYNRTGYPFVPLGRIRSARITGDQAREAAALPAERLTWQEYARIREEWLKPYPHAAYPDSFYRLSRAYGYSFLSFPGALAAVIPLEDRFIVGELLCPRADPARAIAGIAGNCPAPAYEVRTPVFFPGPGEVRNFAYWTETVRRRRQCETVGTVPIVSSEEFWYPFALE